MNTVAPTQTSSSPEIHHLEFGPSANPFIWGMLWQRSTYSICIFGGWEAGGESGRKSKRKGAKLSAVLGPGPGLPWQWLMGSDWAVLQCSGGSEPCSARETFQPLSPLSGAIHPTEYFPQGQGEESGKGAQGGAGGGGRVWRSRGQPTPFDLVSQPALGWEQKSKCVSLETWHAYWASVFDCNRMIERWSEEVCVKWREWLHNADEKISF